MASATPIRAQRASHDVRRGVLERLGAQPAPILGFTRMLEGDDGARDDARVRPGERVVGSRCPSYRLSNEPAGSIELAAHQSKVGGAP